MLVLTLGTDRLIALLDLSERDMGMMGNHGVKINRRLFTKRCVGQQTDLEQYSNFTGS